MNDFDSLAERAAGNFAAGALATVDVTAVNVMAGGGTVNDLRNNWLDGLPALRLSRCLALFSAAMLLFALPVTAVAVALGGPARLSAVAVSGAVCWLGGSLALLIAARFSRSSAQGPLLSLLLGMAFNGAMPFLIGLALYRAGGGLAEAGVFGLMIVFFQFALVVETVLGLCLAKSPR